MKCYSDIAFQNKFLVAHAGYKVASMPLWSVKIYNDKKVIFVGKNQPVIVIMLVWQVWAIDAADATAELVETATFGKVGSQVYI